ncbi:MAG: hypothetical protein GY762_20620 [Proteobacteria bacterium]|nr:hypothetical protein [Pseudomonadota bacterium]
MDNASKTPENGPALEETNISNTAQRVRGIVVVALAIVALAVGVIWYERGQKEMKRQQEALFAVEKAHSAGYDTFWITAKIDVKRLKSNLDFRIRMKQILAEAPVAYGKYIRDKGLPVLDDGVREYRAAVLPAVYADQVEAVIGAMEQLRDAWHDTANELVKWETYLEGKRQLESAANAWVGMQESRKEKYKVDAIKYFNMVQCIMPDRSIVDIKGQNLEDEVLDSCKDNEVDWFRRAAYDCVPILAGEGMASTEDQEDDVFRKGPGLDTTSKFGIEECLKTCQVSVEEEMIERIAMSWAEYVKAKNSLVGTIKSKLEELR